MKNVFFYSLGIIILFSSCFKNKDEDLTVENYNADWALQVINSEFSIAELLDRSDTNNLSIEIVNDDIILSYSTEESSNLSSEFYSLPDQSFGDEYNYEEEELAFTVAGLAFGPILLDSSVVLPNVPLDVDGVAIENAELKEILVETGSMVLTVSNTFSHELVIDLEIPSITLGGVPLSFSGIRIPGNSTVPVTETRTINGHTVDLKYNGALNTLRFKTTIGGELSGDALSSSDKLTFGLEMKDVSYEHIIGRLGEFTIPLDRGSNDISLFDDLDFDGEFHIETFNFKTTTISNWGVPLALNINNLEFVSETANPTVVDCFDEPITMGALDNVKLVGFDSVSTDFDLGTVNCPVLSDVLKTKPTGFEYDLSFTANPLDDQSEDFFISKHSTVKTTLEGQFYLHGYLKGFSRTDTITGLDFSGEDADSDGVIDKASIRFIVENGMPLELGVDLFFLDQYDNVIDEELSKIEIGSAVVNSEGYAVSSTNNTFDVNLSNERMTLISPLVNKIVMKFKLGTAGAQSNQNVHIGPDDKMKIIIGVRATVDMELN